MKSNTIYPPMSEREISGAAISREAATQGMVLLKNINGVLPLKGRGKIALFGNGAARTIRGGTGSGDPFNGGLSGGGDQDVDQSLRYHINILNAMETEGFEIVNREQQMAWARCYDLAKREMKDQVMSVFAFPEEPLTTEKLEEYAKETETAICVISRNSGEGNDRFMKKEVSIGDKKYEIGDYRLFAVEMDNLKKLRSAFSSLILVLNVPGSISVQDLEAACADAILLMGQAGQEGGAAVTDILTGKATPSGKLTATWAKKYEDYPTAGNFLQDFNKAVYTEGIYVGYRYFDTFNVEPGYPFGYGLSYTTFALGNLEASLDEDTLVLGVTVENTGAFAGREVVQIYVSAPVSEMDMPEQELKGFQKTMLLAPGEKEDIKIRIPLRNLASYSENAGGYILSKGDYGVRIGTSSRDTKPVCKIRLEQTALTEQVLVELPLTETLEEKKGLTDRKDETIWKDVPVLLAVQIPETLDSRSAYSDEKVVTYATDTSYQPVMPYETVRYVEKKEWKLNDVASGRVSMEEFAAQLDAAQLADLCCGTGWGVQDENNPVIGASSESVPGAAGETTHALESYGVSSIVLADGPGGVRITQQFEATDLESGEKRQVYHYCTAWPVGTLLAQSFDPEILEQVGCGMAADMQAMRIDLLLGPGMNIQRDPMCGRNFEYFSEDPLISGKMASAMVRGLQSLPGGGGCIKHYAANNQETNRNAVDSVIGQRALREIYLEPYKIAIQESQPLSIMSSYNLINGVPTADSYDLCTDLARGEWGFEGLIMTDWNGGSSTPWKSMHAGNDLIMPGGKGRAMNILQAVRTVIQPLSIMSSYNLINGVPTADSYDLCTDLARGEWGFEGLIMTDWNGGSSTPWKSMHAGNDLIMPGGKGRAMNILQAVRTVMPEFDERGQVIMVQEVPFAPVFAARWNSFTVDPEGPDTVMAPLGEGHTAEMKDGEILVDGEKVYMQANDMKTFFNDPASFVPKICPANEEVAFILDDGRAIGYKGHLDKKPRLCLGDVQRCAVHNLRIILKCMGL